MITTDDLMINEGEVFFAAEKIGEITLNTYPDVASNRKDYSFKSNDNFNELVGIEGGWHIAEKDINDLLKRVCNRLNYTGKEAA